MPYRNAHYWVLLLLPLTALAFWPSYFGDLSAAPYAFHVHGVTATLWILLLVVQSWSIHEKKNGLHRRIGYASFVLFPFFFVGGLLVIRTMAEKVRAGGNPFYDTFGAQLGTVDAISSAAILFLFTMALRTRRKVHLHARYMLATIFFLIPPILSRLLPALPPFAISGPQDFHRFAWGVHLSLGLTILLALYLARRAPRHGRPWLIFAGVVVAQAAAFELSASPAWERSFAALAGLPLPLVVSLGFFAATLAIWAGWSAVPGRGAARARSS
jgi:uncharacterized membrane protein YozB (DUF420 family)